MKGSKHRNYYSSHQQASTEVPGSHCAVYQEGPSKLHGSATPMKDTAAHGTMNSDCSGPERFAVTGK